MQSINGRSAQIFSLLQGGAPMAPAREFAQTEAYWLALRGEGQQIPDRASLDPRGLEDVLDHLLLLERIAPGQMRIRLAGQWVSDLFGLCPRGMPLTALIAPESRGAVAARTEEMFRRPALAEMDLSTGSGLLRPAVTARMLLLPLRGPGGSCDRALACLGLTGDRATGPVPRFGLDRCRFRELPAVQVTAPSRTLAGAAAPGRAASRAPWLRLVKG